MARLKAPTTIGGVGIDPSGAAAGQILRYDGINFIPHDLPGGGGGTGLPVGAMTLWPGSVAPGGWFFCNGGTFDDEIYPELAAVLGSNLLPDFRGRFPIGVGTLGSDTYALAATGGEARHVLTGGEVGAHQHTLANHNHALPNHTHPMPHTHAVGEGQAAGTQVLGRGSGGTGSSDLQTTGTRSITTVSGTGPSGTANTGNPNTLPNTGDPDNNNTSTSPTATAHENRPPYRAINFIIKAAP